MSEELLSTEEVLIAVPGKNFILPPAGNHLAICCGIVHVGTIDTEYQGHKKKQNVIRLGFELPEKKHIFDEKKGPESFVVWKDYTFSLARLKNNKKTNLRTMLENWRGVEMSDEETKTFNILKLLTAPCRMNIIIRTSRGGTDYVDIGSIAMPAETDIIPKQTVPNLVFTFSKPFKTEVFNSLPDFIKDKIKSSKEYLALANPGSVEAKPDVQTTATKGKMPF
jgi:hypothetical protein